MNLSRMIGIYVLLFCFSNIEISNIMLFDETEDRDSKMVTSDHDSHLN